MEIYIEHPQLLDQETRLESDVLASATSSTVENTKSFANGDYVVFGALGEEKTEIVPLTSVTAPSTIGHSTGPVFPHSARTPVTKIKYNQAKVYSASSEDGTYSLLATVDLTLDQPYTVYDDTAGTSVTWYKIKYFNSSTSSLSSYSVAVQSTGYTEDSLRSMADEVLEDFNDSEGKDLKRSQVYKHLRGGVRKVTTELIKSYPDYFKSYTTQALTAGVSTYTLPSRFLAFLRVDVNFTGSVSTDGTKADFIGEDFGESDTVYYQTDPLIAKRGTSFVIRPTPTSSSGYAFIWYWAYPTPMTTDSSEHGLPYGARDVLVKYALWRAWISKDADKATPYKSAFNDALDGYIDFVSQSTQTMSKDHVRVVQGDDLYEFD